MVLYGDLPTQATKDFISKIPKDTDVTALWVYFGRFLDKYYTQHRPLGVPEIDPKVADKVTNALLKSYNDQHHSGYSHLVVTQMIMEYLSGKMPEVEKQQIRGNEK